MGMNQPMTNRSTNADYGGEPQDNMGTIKIGQSHQYEN